MNKPALVGKRYRFSQITPQSHPLVKNSYLQGLHEHKSRNGRGLDRLRTELAHSQIEGQNEPGTPCFRNAPVPIAHAFPIESTLLGND